MRYEPICPQFFVRNCQNLRGLLRPNSLVILHANNIYPSNADGTLPFKQNSDLYYLTGVSC